MGILWVVDKPVRGGSKVALALQGQFAVRTFGSLKSLSLLSEWQAKPRPDAVIICAKGLKGPLEHAQQFVHDILPQSLAVFLIPKAELGFNQKEGVFLIADDVEAFSLSTKLQRLLKLRDHRDSSLQYKSIRVDLHRLKVSIAGVSEPLTLRESQLLRYFIENRKRCIPREELQDQVWQQKVAPRTVDSQVSKLRRRLAQSGVMIESVYGGGYVLQ